MNNNNIKLLVFSLFIGLFSTATYWIGYYQNNHGYDSVIQKTKWEPVSFVLDHLLNSYVDSLSSEKLKQAAIRNILKELDPHSSYIPAEDRVSANESLLGHFGGVGIRFMILRDSLTVVNVIKGGPSEKQGIQKRDRIIKINNDSVASTGLTNEDVLKKLKGKIGSKVLLTIKTAENKLVEKTIVRDMIKLKSVAAYDMIDDRIGYIKLTTFSSSTDKEIVTALNSLKERGMSKLILDLRFNGGGYLHQAIHVADQFLDKHQMVVYTKGAHTKKESQFASEKGAFKSGDLVILVNSTTASASEIVSGAIQDHKRGVIIGRRTFGKGLVQSPLMLEDSSEIRITTSRYYTPSGKSIQKPYGDSINYEEDLFNRISNGELSNIDSMSKDQSKGGIWPDIFSPIDTVEYRSTLYNLIYSRAWRDYCFDYYEKNPVTTTSDIRQFYEQFRIEKNDLNEFLKDQKIETNIKPEEFNEFNKSMKLELSSYYFSENARYIISTFDDDDVKLAKEYFANKELRQ